MDKPFPLPLKVTPDRASRWWTLDAPFDYRSPFGLVTCNPGFKTDFATIPPVNVVGAVAAIIGYLLVWAWLFWLGMALCLIAHKLLHTGSYTRAAVVHDKIYSTHQFTRAQCDATLYEGMKDSGTAFWKRILIWGNVRLFGWLFWNRTRSV